MSETEIQNKLQLIEDRQKYILGNQTTILKLIERQQKANAVEKKSFRQEVTTSFYQFLAGVGVVSILRTLWL